MTNRNYDDYTLSKYMWKPQNPLTKALPNMAFDGETENGFVRLMSDSNGRTVASDEVEDFLEFLIYKGYRKTVNFFYNLGYDHNSLLKYLDYDRRRELIVAGKVQVGGYMISVMLDKELKISRIVEGEFNKDGTQKIKNSTCFYDLANFYNYKKLKDLAKQVGMEKVEVEDIANIDWDKYFAGSINGDVESNEHPKNRESRSYNALINRRCIVDCEITKALADKLTNEVNKLVIINKYYSKASISRKLVLTSLKKQLSLPDHTLLRAALYSYHAGHSEVFRMGMQKNVSLYDVNSAYPSQMAELYETDGRYNFNREYDPGATYSYYECEVDYTINEYASPLWFTAKNNTNYHATGKMTVWITKPEYEFLDAKGCDIKILRAYHLTKTKDAEQPFRSLIQDLYQRRLECKKEGDPFERTLKYALNSLYGIAIQSISSYEAVEDGDGVDEWIVTELGEILDYKRKYETGNLWNPLFAAEITARTRIKIFNDFWKYFKYVNSLNTDGIFINRKLHHLKIGDKLGEYSEQPFSDYLIVGSGRYFNLEDGIVDDGKSAFRSASAVPSEMYGAMNVELKETSLKIEKVKVIKLKESQRKSNYNLTFSTFPIQEFNKIDLFNTFQTVTKKINFFETRRVWNDQFNNIGEVFEKQLNSRPFDVTNDKLK